MKPLSSSARFALGFAVLVGAATLGLVGCQPPESKTAGPAGERLFEVRGVIQELPQNDATRVIIDHEEIPDYMQAMIMPFRAKSAEALAELEPGMVVTFDYHVRETESWIENLQPTGEIGEIKDTAAILAPTTPLLEVGEVLPDYAFLDQDGQPTTLSDFRGKPVAMTFVFSRCPVPEYCPAMMRNFKAVLDSLEADPEAPEDWHLLTISFDSFNDTPELMKSWGAAWGHRPGQPWTLLTSETCCTVRDIAGNVGLRYGEINGSYQHNLRTVVLDAEGRIRKIFTDETWTNEALIAEIKSADRVGTP